MPQVPGPLRLTPSFPFVGRARELAALRALLPYGEDDETRVALLSGEAGAGKSRLVRELAHEAAADDVLVLYGACDAVVHAPYAPIVSALEQLERVTEPDVLRADLGTTGGELTRLIPDLGARVGGLPDPTQRRPRLRAPPALHRGVGAARARQPSASAAARRRGHPLGGSLDAAPALAISLARPWPLACSSSRRSATRPSELSEGVSQDARRPAARRGPRARCGSRA